MSNEPNGFAKYLVIFVDILGSQNRVDFQETYKINKIFHEELERNKQNDMIHTVYFLSLIHIFKYFLADKWEVENRKLNNYVHSNGKKYLTDNYVHPGKTEKDKELIETMNNIVDIFLSVLIMIDSTKCHSSDYVDALEMGIQLVEGSQYWVCPAIFEYMNKRFDKKLLSYIQKNEGYGMQFFEA